MENKNKKVFANWLENNLQKIIIFIVSITYITQGVFSLTSKGGSIFEIIGSMGLSIIIGIIISNSLNNMGLTRGRNSELFINSSIRYAEVKKEAVPYLDKITAWCEYKNSQELENKKRTIIQTNGLNWKAFKLGYYENHTDKLNDEQKKALELAKKVKILKLNSQELLSDLQKPMNSVFVKSRSKFGESEKDFKNINLAQDIITRLGIGIVCGMYSLEPLVNKDNVNEIVAGVIWNSMQIIMWLSFGIMKYYNAKSFMVDEYRHTHIISKTEYLNEFIVTMKNNPSVIDKYDEDIEINKYIDEFIKDRSKGEVVDEQ